MLNDAQLAKFRAQLASELDQLASDDTNSADARKTVILDQQSVGRLSRMDALQQQAMAEATQRRRQARRQRITAAFRRIDENEFGYCQDCGDDVDLKRLTLDPTTLLCQSCAAG